MFSILSSMCLARAGRGQGWSVRPGSRDTAATGAGSQSRARRRVTPSQHPGLRVPSVSLAPTHTMSHLISRCPGGRAARPRPGESAGGTAPPTWRTAPCPPAPGRLCPREAAGTGALSTGATSARCQGSSPRDLGKRHSPQFWGLLESTTQNMTHSARMGHRMWELGACDPGP